MGTVIVTKVNTRFIFFTPGWEAVKRNMTSDSQTRPSQLFLSAYIHGTGDDLKHLLCHD
jgi:hypothetical protein